MNWIELKTHIVIARYRIITLPRCESRTGRWGWTAHGQSCEEAARRMQAGDWISGRKPDYDISVDCSSIIICLPLYKTLWIKMRWDMWSSFSWLRTHSCKYRQPWTLFFLFIPRNFTANRGHTLKVFTGWPWTFPINFCVCAVSTNYLTMDLPLPLKKSMVVKQFQMHSYAICSLLEVLLTTMDVHGRCVSMVMLSFFSSESTVESKYKRIPS